MFTNGKVPFWVVSNLLDFFRVYTTTLCRSWTIILRKFALVIGEKVELMYFTGILKLLLNTQAHLQSCQSFSANVY